MGESIKVRPRFKEMPEYRRCLHSGVFLNSDFVALCQEIHPGGKHQDLEFHAFILNKPAVFKMNQ